MRLRNTPKMCLVFWKSEPHYAYKRYAYKKKTCRLGTKEAFSYSWMKTKDLKNIFVGDFGLQ